MKNTAGETGQEIIKTTECVTSQTAEAEKDSGEKESAQFGKFSNAKDLLDAYNSLQSEFTRRCQRVKELERENDCLRASEKPERNSLQTDGHVGKPAFKEIYPETQEIMKSLYETAASTGDDAEGFLERAYVKYLKDKVKAQDEYYSSHEYIFDKAKNDQEIKEGIIREYLDGVNASKPKVWQYLGNGDGLLSPPSKPRTLQDASKIALQIFEKAKEIK